MGGDHERHGHARRRRCRSAARSSSSATTCAARSASPRSARPTSSTRGPTTRSASARTARPTSRSSSSPSLRAMPGLRVIRPADANETAQAWRVAVDARRPDRARSSPARTCRCSRAPPATRACSGAPTCSRRRPTATPDLVLIGTGSEVSVCVDAAELLAADGLAGAGGVDAVLGAVRRAGRRLPATRCCRPACPTLAVEAGDLVRLGPLGRRRRSASTTSAPRPPGRGRPRGVRLHREQRGRTRRPPTWLARRRSTPHRVGRISHDHASTTCTADRIRARGSTTSSGVDH